jgi:predicted ATP-binding protein involved in virulence
MRIKKVKWNNHPILGNLELDFSKGAGQIYENILFAGENGTGKTSILESMSTFLNKGSFDFFAYIEYEVNGQIIKAIQPEKSINKDFFDIVDATNTRHKMHTNKNNINQSVDENPLNIRYSGCVFSKARADFKTQQIKHITTKELDKDKYDVDNEDDFTSLKQLIVDVQNQDNEDYYNINNERQSRGENPISIDKFYQTSRIHRFKNAFNTFFDKIKYDRVRDINGEKSILFEKNSKEIPVDKLSTGEKQIVFRGAYLLKNTKKLEGAAIMVDEPELSMHPKWQEKILQYYKNLFTESDGIQKAQLFFATHSEHVLKEALGNKNKNLVIVLTDNAGIIESKRIDAPSVLPTITNAETNYLTFDIVSNDYHIELYGSLQEKEGLYSVKQCDDYIKVQPEYNSTIHEKTSSFTHPRSSSVTNYDTLSTYIWNCIDHPSTTMNFSEIELRTSIELLIKLVR